MRTTRKPAVSSDGLEYRHTKLGSELSKIKRGFIPMPDDESQVNTKRYKTEGGILRCIHSPLFEKHDTEARFASAETVPLFDRLKAAGMNPAAFSLSKI